ncbi:ribonuclease [Pectobacterium phage POP12]|nr:ribonuclease [Pectobacterium phage POP12]
MTTGIDSASRSDRIGWKGETLMSMASMFNLNALMQDDKKEDEDVCVMDISNLAFATLFANYSVKEQNEINQNTIRHIILDTVRANVMKFKNNYPDIVLALDDNKYWRRNVAPYYKQKRRMEKAASDWDWDRLNSFIFPVYEELRQNLPYKVIRADFAEGDDIMGVITKNAVAEGKLVMVVSSDSDEVQLQKYSGVKQWSPTQKKLVTPKYGSPINDLRMKIIKGDAKDSIACIKMRSDYIISKVDGERAPQIRSTELEEWLDAVDPVSLIEKVNPEWAKRYKENEILRDFDFIPVDIQENIMIQYKQPNIGNKSKMSAYFIKNGLVRLYEKINDF